MTFTIAGVTRAATASIARSSANSGSMLLSSSAGAAGAGAAAAIAEVTGFPISYAPNDSAISAASEGTMNFFFNFSFQASSFIAHLLR